MGSEGMGTSTSHGPLEGPEAFLPPTPRAAGGRCLQVPPAGRSLVYNSGRSLSGGPVGSRASFPFYLGRNGKNESHRKTNQAPVTLDLNGFILCVFSPFPRLHSK